MAPRDPNAAADRGAYTGPVNSRIRRAVLAVVLAGSAASPQGPLRAQDGGGDAPPPPPPDNRFFPKEMEDALAALAGSDPEDSFQQGLAVLDRLRGRDGAAEALGASAFEPVLAHALGSRREHVASFAGEFLAALDAPRLVESLAPVVEQEQDARRLRNAAALLERTRGVRTLDLLSGLVQKGDGPSRARACEALGEVARADAAGEPAADEAAARERACGRVLDLYGIARGSELGNVCAVALGKMRWTRAIPALASGLSVTDGKHGFFAALALGWMEDPAAFAAVQAVRPGSGEAGEAHAKAYEATAREGDVTALLSTLANAGRADFREAAAIALGRIVSSFPDPATAPPQEAERAATRVAVARALLDRMMADREEGAQWAAFHALARCGGPWMADDVVRLLNSGNGDTLARAVHLAGDWKIAAAADRIQRAVFAMRDKDVMMRRRLGVELWRIGDRPAIDAFKEKVRGLSGGAALARACDVLGSWRTPESFRLCLDLLKTTRSGSPDQFQVELALEKMTGHFFGPEPGLWEKWFEKNPEFFTRKQARVEREKWREDFDKENKGFRQTKETEKAVQMGLDYLARHQASDGAWDPQKFRQCCDDSPPCSAGMGARVQEDPVSRTALSVLAFMGAGYSPRSGKFHVAVRRGLEYLMARQQVMGDYLTNDLIGGYNRPVCLQAYAEAMTATRDPVYEPFVRKGVDFLTQIQNSIGGWRYRVKVETSDSSVAAWMLFAMKAAEKAGAEVRPIVYEGCRSLFERYSVRVPQNGEREEFVDTDPDYGFEVGRDTKYEYRTGYQDQALAPTHSTTALGLMSHILLGFRRSHPFCIGSANHILRTQLPSLPKDGDVRKVNIAQEYPMYFLYYGTLAMHQMGGRYFRTWNERLRAILPPLQETTGCPRGSWPGKNIDGLFGSLYTTAAGVLALETYYRYLPVLQD